MYGSEIIIVPIFFLSVFGILALYFIMRNRERMAMIEKGADPSIFKTTVDFGILGLKTALLFIGIGLGLIFGYLLTLVFNFNGEVEISFFSMIFIFGGLSLVLANYLTKKH